MHEGRCLCGNVRYEVDGPFAAVVNCHCSMCRKHHGSAYVTWAVAPASGFRIVTGNDSIGHFESSPGLQRSFCTVCGSVLPEITPSGESVVVPAGNLTGDLGLQPQLHMFVKSKAPWFDITDQLPQHDEWPPAFGMQPVARAPVPTQAGVTQGSCLCGGVAYEISTPPLRFYHCHCSRCRLARGAAHASNVFFSADGFRWTRGADLVVDYALPGARFFGTAFCRRCGSDVPRVARERGIVNVPAGTLDTDPGIAATAHIFVDSRADWDTLGDDGLPRFAAMPPSR